MRPTRKRNQGDDDERHGGVDVGPPGNVSPQDGNVGGKVDDVVTPYKKKGEDSKYPPFIDGSSHVPH